MNSFSAADLFCFISTQCLHVFSLSEDIVIVAVVVVVAVVGEKVDPQN